MSYLVIVSNRGPFSFSRDFLQEAQECLKKNKRPRRINFGEGGLVQAMAGLLKPGKWNTTWLGASMGDMDIDVARGHYTRLFKRMEKKGYAPRSFPHIEIQSDRRMRFRYRDNDFFMRFVFFDTTHMHSYYNRFANGFLWPLMHLTRAPLFYKKSRVFPRPQFEKNAFIQYVSSSVTFANTIIDEIRKTRELENKEGDVIIWNQDYHLMRIAEVYKAQMIDEELPEKKRKRIHVGQFMHTPFFNIHEIQGLIREDKRIRVKENVYDPFSENIETVLQKITMGMLANDFIGFHIKEYCDNYLEALEEWFPVKIRINGQFYEIKYQDRVTTIGAFPIGLDVDKILTEVQEGKKLSFIIEKTSLREKINMDRESGKYIFGGIERCDYTKGLIERLGIFYHSFRRLKDLKKDARFYQVTSPSRSGSPEYQNLNNILEEEILKKNSQMECNPIIYFNKGIPTPQNYRFMKEMDVMLVTPLEDGMNLVAFEYILSQKYKRPEDRGILVLSTSGASRVLKQKGYSEKDGIVFINPMNAKDAGEKTVQALLRGRHISDEVIQYVEKERRVDEWAEKNINAILNSK